MVKPFIVGITGGSASGKTRFLKSLIKHFDTDEICLVSQDNYYKDRHLQPKDENGVENFDTPQSIEFDDYAADISKLKEGETVTRKEYTFNNPNVAPSMLTFNPAKVIVVEGLFVFYFPELTKLLDLKVFIDAKDYVKLKRRILRDNSERGYDLDDVLYRYEKHVAPTYEKYIAPFKFDADIIIPNNNGFDKGLDILVSYLKERADDE